MTRDSDSDSEDCASQSQGVVPGRGNSDSEPPRQALRRGPWTRDSDDWAREGARSARQSRSRCVYVTAAAAQPVTSSDGGPPSASESESTGPTCMALAMQVDKIEITIPNLKLS